MVKKNYLLFVCLFVSIILIALAVFNFNSQKSSSEDISSLTGRAITENSKIDSPSLSNDIGSIVFSPSYFTNWDYYITGNESVLYNVKTLNKTQICIIPKDVTLKNMVKEKALTDKPVEIGTAKVKAAKSENSYNKINVTYDYPDSITLYGGKNREILLKKSLSKEKESDSSICFDINPLASLFYKLGEMSIILSGVTTYNSTNTNVTNDDKFSHLNLTDGALVLYVPFDMQENLSYYALDYSNFSNDVNVWFDIAPPTFEPAGGKYGGSYNFDPAQDERMDVPKFSSTIGTERTFDIPGKVTFSAWIKPDSNTGGGIIGSGNMKFLANASDGRLDFYLWDNSDTEMSIGVGGYVTTGTWQYIAATYNRATGNQSIYYNGVLIATQNAPNANLSWNDPSEYFHIGENWGNYFDGSMDEVMVFNRTLSATEIRQIYNSTYPRFLPTGEMFFNNFNFATKDMVNISISNCQQLNGSSIKFKINNGAYSTLNSSCMYNNYSISGNLTNANMTFQLNSTNSKYFSPLVVGDINLNPYYSSGAPVTYSWSNELMTNGGFEWNNLTGWTTSGGSWATGTSPSSYFAGHPGQFPQAGSYLAYYGDTSSLSYYIQQDVNLTSYASYIDSGTAVINASGWAVSSEYNAGYDIDRYRIKIFFLDSGKNIISTNLDSDYHRNDSWTQYGISNYYIPRNTRYIRMWGNLYEFHDPDYFDAGSLDSFSVKLGYEANVDTTAPAISLLLPTPGNTSSALNPVTVLANISDASNTSSWIDLDRSLIGYWAMDYYNSTGVFDNSSYNNFVSFSGGIGTSNIATGVRGSALAFDGANDQLEVAALHLGTSATFDAWAYSNSFSSSSMLWNHHSVEDSNYYDLFFANGWILLNTGDSYGNPFNSSTNTPFDATTISLNVWHHYVVVVNASMNKALLYIDGVNVGNASYKNPTFTPGQTTDIGGASGYIWNGMIDEVRIYNRSLSRAEVLASYDSKNNNFSTSAMTLSLGQHNFTIYAIDQAGNSANSGWNYFNVTPAGSDLTPPTYSQVSVNNTLAGLITLFSINVNDNLALHPNGQYIFSTNNSGVWLNYSLFGSRNYWQKDLVINSSLPDIGSYSAPTVFYKDSSWYLISANGDGGFNGYAWNGTGWKANTTINASLFNDTNMDSPTVFYKDSSWYLISGDYDGKFYGYAWNGTNWKVNTTINGSLPNLGYGGWSTPNVFYKDSSWYLIGGNASGKFYGYAWNGTGWAVNITINASLPDIGSYSAPSVFYKDGNLYLISGSGNSDGKFYGYKWNGANWVVDLTINASLVYEQDYSTPSVFYKDGILNLISGGWDGIFYGHNYSSSYNFTTTPSWANVTTILNSTVGTGVGYRWYFDDNASNTNSTPIYYLTTTNAGTLISSCQNLTSANTVYTLSQNVSSTTYCFFITADNVTLDCNGFFITSGTGGGDNSYGIRAQNIFNGTVENCRILHGYDPAGYFYGASKSISLASSTNFTIMNNWVNGTDSAGIHLESSNYNTLINNTGISKWNQGIRLSGSSYNTLINNTGISYDNSVAGNEGLTLSGQSNYNLLINNTGRSGTLAFTARGIYIADSFSNTITGLNVSGYFGILMINASYNNVTDCIASGSDADVNITATWGTSPGNILLNCSYNKEEVDGANSQLIRKWYYQAYANYSNGTAAVGVNITATNTTGRIQFTQNTSSAGWITMQNLTEYNDTGGTKVFYNNYTLNASLTGFTLISRNNYNLTLRQNNVSDFFTFTGGGVDASPSVTLSYPYDNYFNSTNQYVNIIFNASVTDDRNLVNCSLWTNYSGTWILNQTQSIVGIANITNMTINSLTNKIFIWNIQCYDNASQSAWGSANRTVKLNYTASDTTPPTYSHNSTNNTAAGQITKFAINVSDNVALNPNGMYIFATNNTWNNATLMNDSPVFFSTTPSWANVTKILNSTVGKIIGYRWYFNDSAGNVNSTPVYYLNTTVYSDTTPPVISLLPPTPSNTSSSPSSVEIVANISDASNTSSWIDIDRSLIGYWAMDYYNKTVIFDNSTYRNNATFPAGTGLNYTNLTIGSRGQALKFDGGNDYLDLGTPSSLASINSGYTISAWVNPATLAQNGIIMDIEPTNTDYAYAFGIYVDGDELLVGSQYYQYDLAGISSYLTAGRWQHWVIVFHSDYSIEFYLDGVKQALSYEGGYYGMGGNRIGARNYADYRYFNGSIDEVMVFNRDLSSTEVKALYDSKNNNFDTSYLDLPNGQHNYTVYAVDQYGNTANSGWNYFNLTGTEATGCMDLDVPGRTYYLTRDITYGGTCFPIGAENVTLDCQGHWITYGTDGNINDYAIEGNEYSNLTVLNCNIVDGYWADVGGGSWRPGVVLNGNGSTMLRNFVWNNPYQAAIYVNGWNSNITNNTGLGGEGLYSEGSVNISVVNNNLSSAEYRGIDLSALTRNSVFIGNNISSGSSSEYGFILEGSSNNLLINNTVMGPTAIYLYNSGGVQSSNNTFINNTAISTTSPGIAIDIMESDNNTFIQQTALSLLGGGESSAFNIYYSNNTMIRDCVNIASSDAGFDIDFTLYDGMPSWNTTAVNCSFNTADDGGPNMQLIKKWYYQVYVNDTSGNPVNQANITIKDVSNVLQFTELTNSSGWIQRKELIDYIDTDSTKTYFSNYTINASKIGYAPSNKSYNATFSQNKIRDYITLTSYGDYLLRITNPTTANPKSVSSGDNISIYFNFSQGGTNITSGLDIDSVLIGGVNATILNSPTYNGTVNTYYFRSLANLTGNNQVGNLSSIIGTTIKEQWKGTANVNETIYFVTDALASNMIIPAQAFPVTLWCNRSNTNANAVMRIENYSIYDCSDSQCSTKTLICYSGNLGTNMNCYQNALTQRSSSACSISTPQTISAGHYIGLQLVTRATDAGTRFIFIAYNSSTYFSHVNVTSNMTNGSAKSFTYTPAGWQVNVTAPTFSYGLKDLYVNATYFGNTANNTQANAIDYGGVDCSNLNTAGATYILTQNVSSAGTCFNITNENITLNCNNSWINYSTGGGPNTYGIFSNQFNTTIKNCKVLDMNWTSSNTNRYGIYFNTNDNSTLFNNFVNVSNSDGVYLTGNANYNNVTNNNIFGNSSNSVFYVESASYNWLINNTVTSNTDGYGIAIVSYSDNNTITGNKGISKDGTGITVSSSSRNNLTNNNGTSSTGMGIWISSSSDNCILVNNTGESGGTGAGTSIGIYIQYSLNATLINNTGKAKGSSGIDIESSSNSNLTNNTGVSNTSAGIYVYGSSNTNLTNNNGTTNTNYGIELYFSGNSTFVRNIGTGNSGLGLLFQSCSNLTITNNNGTSNSNLGIYLLSSSYNNLTNNNGMSDSNNGISLGLSSYNNLTNNNGTSNNSVGININTDSYDILINNTGMSLGAGTQGIYLQYSSNSTLINNTGISNTGVATILVFDSDTNFIGHTARTIGTTGAFNSGVYVWSSNNTIFRDCINISGVVQDVYYASSAGSFNNTFINCSYTKESVTGAGNELIRKWYYKAYVNYSNGSAASDVNVSVFNNLNVIPFTEQTNATGWIQRKEVTEYNNSAGSRIYSNNYTINASKAGYATDTHIFNFTLQHNKVDDFFTLQNVSICANLNVANSNYTLNSNISVSGGCFVISADNVTLDCNNYWITYSTGGVAGDYGIYSANFNTTIKNCNILDGNWSAWAGAFRYAIYFNTADNGTIFNNFANTSNSAGIYFGSVATFNNLTKNRLTSNSSQGIYLFTFSNNNILINNTATSNSGAGIIVYNSSGNNISSNNLTSNSNAGILFTLSSANNTLSNNIVTSTSIHAIYLTSSSGNTLINNTGICLGSNDGIYLTSSSNNNILTNNTGISNVGNSGIGIDSSSSNNLTNNTGMGNGGGYGISLSSSSYNNLTNNNGTAIGTGYGINLLSSSNNNLIGNNATSTGVGYAIELDLSSNNSLIRNTAVGNIGPGIRVEDYSSNNTLTNNNATSITDVGIFFTSASNNNLTNNIATSTNQSGIYLTFSSNNNTLMNNTGASNKMYGIILDTSSNNNTLILNRGISNLSYGILLSTSSNNNITNNNGTSNINYGIWLGTSSNNTLTNNIGTSNTSNGIYLSASSNNNTLTGNNGITILGTGNGIYILTSSNITLTGNNGTSKNGYGIFFNQSSNSTLTNNNGTSYSSHGIYLALSNNTIFTNNTGMNVAGAGDGIYIISSSNNTLSSNGGIGSTNQGIEIGLLSNNNTLINNTGISIGSGVGIYIDGNLNNNLINNNGTSYGNGYGIMIDSASNITLTRNTGTGNSSIAIYIESSLNNTLTGNNGTSNGSFGIFLGFADNNTLTNNTFASNLGAGIGIDSSYNNNLTNNNGTSSSNVGIYIHDSSNNLLINNTATSNTWAAIYIWLSSNNTFIGQTARTLGTTGSRYAVYFEDSSYNTIFRDCVNISGATKDIYYTLNTGSVNNTFINCSYNTETVQGTGNQLIRKWYYKAYVNDTSGNPIQSANVYAYNVSNIQQFTDSTNSSGWIQRQEITEYVNTGGTISYYSNYTINATKSGYSVDVHIYNLTLRLNKLDDFFTLSNSSCVYTGGNWIVNCSSYCNITVNVDVGGNNISIMGVGIFTTTANISNYLNLHIEGMNSTNICRVRCLNGGCFKN